MSERKNGFLIVTRHGTSQANAENRWTGTANPSLAFEGFGEAQRIAQGLQRRGIIIDKIYTSRLDRAINTAWVIEQEYVSDPAIPVYREIPTVLTKDLNERSVGIYTGRLKKEVIDELGQEAYHAFHTDWTLRIPGGESLDDVSHRTIPILDKDILPQVREGKTVLMVVHNNVVRATDRHLQQFEETRREEKVRMENCESNIYQFTPKGRIVSHEVLLSA